MNNSAWRYNILLSIAYEKHQSLSVLASRSKRSILFALRLTAWSLFPFFCTHFLYILFADDGKYDPETLGMYVLGSNGECLVTRWLGQLCIPDEFRNFNLYANFLNENRVCFDFKSTKIIWYETSLEHESKILFI